MDKDKKSFLIYLDYKEHFDLLTDEQLGMLMRAIMEYESTGKEPKIDGVLKMAFSFIKKQLDRDREKWKEEKNKKSEAGKKGMAKRWAKTGKDNTDNNDNGVITKDNTDNNDKNAITEITVTDNVTVTDTVTDNVTVTDIYPSYHPSKNENSEETDINLSEDEKIRLDEIFEKAQVFLYDDNIKNSITTAITSLFADSNTREKISNIRLHHIDFALKKFSEANNETRITFPNAYFRKCLLSALDDADLSNFTEE